MPQLSLSVSASRTPPMDAIVDDLVFKLRRRQILAAQRRAAYVRFACHILGADVAFLERSVDNDQSGRRFAAA